MTIRLALIRQKYRADGGAERFISRAIDALKARGLELTVLTRKWEGKDDLNVITCNPPKWGRISRERGFAREVCNRVSLESFDLVQSHERLACCDLYRAGDGVHKAWLNHRKRVLSPLQGKWLDFSPYHKYVCKAERAMFESPQLRAVICNSNMVREEIINSFDISPSKLHVIYNGVDTALFNPQIKKTIGQAARKELGFDDETPVLIFVGSGFERKGLKAAIESLAHSKTKTQLLVIGQDKKTTFYKKLAQRLNLASQVKFLGVQKDVKPFYAAADALLLPTLYDPFPNVILEAMACGLPVITSRQCGGAELIQQDENGYVYDALDTSGLASAVTKLQDRNLCLTQGRNARMTVEPLNLNFMAQKMTDLYLELLG